MSATGTSTTPVAYHTTAPVYKMADLKEPVITEHIPFDSENAGLPEEKKGTMDDQRDMFRMGKAQEMRV